MGERLSVTGVVVDPLSKRAVGERDHAEDGVLAGRFDGLRQVVGPFGVVATGTGRLPHDALLLEEPGLSVGAGCVTEVVLQDVGTMDAGVERDGPVELLMPPGRDHHGVAAAHGRLHDELPLADGAVVEQRPHQPVDGVATEILRH